MAGEYSFIGATGFVGGAKGDIDNIPVACLADGDHLVHLSSLIPYTYNSAVGGIENSPWLIAPDDAGGNERWQMVGMLATGFEASVAAGDPKYVFDIGGVDKFVIGVDDDDSDKWKLCVGAAIGTNTAVEIDSSMNVNVAAHDGSSVGLQLGGTLITATGVEVNSLDGITAAGTSMIQAADAAAQLALLSGHAGAAFSWNSQNLTAVGTIGCNEITIADGHGLNLQEDITFTGATTVNQIKFPDNLAAALVFQEGANAYQTFKSTNGSEAVIFHKNVGIGTTSPEYQLDLNGGTTVNERLRLQRGSDDTHQYGTYGWNQINLYRDNVALASAQTTFSINQVGSDGTRTPFYISTSGNVGIGTTSPTHKIELAAATTAAGGMAFGTDVELYRSAANVLTLAAGDSFDIAGHDGAAAGLKLGGTLVTASAAELNILDGVSGVTAAELSYIGDVTGLIQAQLDAKAPIDAPTFTTSITIPETAHDSDPDKFLCSVSGLVKYRTGAQVLSDIGGEASGTAATAISDHESTYNHANYDTAYGWGDHAGLYSLVDHDHDGDYQPLDATLTSLADLGTAANKMLYTTDVDTWAEAAITAAGRAILDDANAAAQCTTLGLGISDTVQFGLLGVGVANSVGMLDIDQPSAEGAKPCISLDQGDESYAFIRFNGTTSAANADMSLVKASDFPTPGTLYAWVKVGIWDSRAVGDGGIPDGHLWFPVYTTPH